MRFQTQTLFDNNDMSATVSSRAMNCARMTHLAIQAEVTAGATAPNGTLTLQASAEPEFAGSLAYTAPTRWENLPGAQAVTGVNSTNLWNVSEAGYNWIRLTYTRSGGGGGDARLNARINLKGPE